MCTLNKRGNVFILTLTGEGEHRLNPALIDSIRAALSQVRSQASEAPGSHALVTTAVGKFYSNGFDLAPAGAGARDRLCYLVDCIKPMLADLMSLPMPTIAAVTGHAVTAGLVLAISHDYVLMRKDRGVLYMGELDLGVSLPELATAVWRERLGSPAARRDVLLRTKKLRAEEAVRMGIVESAHGGPEETVEAAVRLGEELAGRKWNGEVYGEIRKGLFPATCKELGLVAKVVVAPTPRL